VNQGIFGYSKCLFGENTGCTVCFVNHVESALNNRDIVRARLLLFADEVVANSVYFTIFLQIILSLLILPFLLICIGFGCSKSMAKYEQGQFIEVEIWVSKCIRTI